MYINIFHYTRTNDVIEKNVAKSWISFISSFTKKNLISHWIKFRQWRKSSYLTSIFFVFVFKKVYMKKVKQLRKIKWRGNFPFLLESTLIQAFHFIFFLSGSKLRFHSLSTISCLMILHNHISLFYHTPSFFFYFLSHSTSLHLTHSFCSCANQHEHTKKNNKKISFKRNKIKQQQSEFQSQAALWWLVNVKLRKNIFSKKESSSIKVDGV